MRVTIELQPGRDDGILAWLEAQGNRSEAIREALRAQVGRQGVTLEDVYAAVMDSRQMISGMTSGRAVDSRLQISGMTDVDVAGTELAAERLGQLGL